MPLDAPAKVPEGTRLLLVDQNEVTRTAVSERLVAAGIEVQACRFPEYGTGWLKRGVREKRPFNAVITDIVFPDVSQGEIVRFLKGLVRREVPTIIFTAGAWENPPKVGFPIVPKDFDNYWTPLYSAIASALMRKPGDAPVNSAAFLQLTRPQSHIASPMAKWMSSQIRSLSSGNMGLAEKKSIVVELEFLQLRREMTGALGQENNGLSSRDMDELWGKYEQLLRLRRQSSVRSTFQVASPLLRPLKPALARTS